MKTEFFILAITNPINGKLTLVCRGTRLEASLLLLDRVSPGYVTDADLLTRAREAAKAGRFDEFDLLAGSGLLVQWQIQKFDAEVNDPDLVCAVGESRLLAALNTRLSRKLKKLEDKVPRLKQKNRVLKDEIRQLKKTIKAGKRPARR